MDAEIKSKPVDPEETTLFRGLEKLPPELWEDASRLDPRAVSRRAGIIHQPGRGYVVPFLGVDHLVRPGEKSMTVPAGARRPGFQAGLVILNYLVHASDEGLAGRMAADRELNGGELFFKGPHALNKAPVLERFGRDSAGFLARAQSWGASTAAGGDAAFKLLALPKVLVAYTLYEADEEFDAQLSITFDASIDKFLPLDSIWALINVISNRLAEEGNKNG
ncbi:MAG: DUF3786 domain-containing protein [Pseudomonadota bacterium]